MATLQGPETLCLIPARGGSKGIPRKNVKSLGGRPLLAYSVDQARQTAVIRRVVVSTDDLDIGKVAMRYGAEVVWRPAEISGDTASSESALLHALDYLQDQEGYQPDLVVFLQATSPLRRSDDIARALATFRTEGADSLFSACPVEGFVWREQSGQVTPLNYDPTQRKRRQECGESVLEENGSIYVFKPWVLRQLHSRLGGRIAVYRMDRLHSFQVDVPSDLELMERLLMIRDKGSELEPNMVRGLAAIRLLVLDFDGVMTDNRVLVDQEGTEAVWCDRSDGWGIARAKEAGVQVVVLSTETNPVVVARCRKLDIQCIQGCDKKLVALQEVARRGSLNVHEIAYVGNDVNDLDCLRWVGFPIAPSDAAVEVRDVVRLITPQRGGHGAVRQVVDWILETKTNAVRPSRGDDHERR